MIERPLDQLLEVQSIPPVTVVRFKRRTILDPSAIETIGRHLQSLCDTEPRPAVLLNFTGVESLTSAMLGEFAVLHRVLSEGGGRLAFCGVDAFLLQVFKVVKIPERIPIYPDEAQALQALSAESK